jgi:hypothetical protein
MTTIENSPPGFYWTRFREYTDLRLVQIIRYPLNQKHAYVVNTDSPVKFDVPEELWDLYTIINKVEQPS